MQDPTPPRDGLPRLLVCLHGEAYGRSREPVAENAARRPGDPAHRLIVAP